jgi:D-alanine-D-alanine ligase
MRSPDGDPPFPEVTVLLGDPNLPDVTKVGFVYSAEDLESVTRMKAALASLGRYRFSYLDDHTRLVADLTSNPPAFVLNLCDTGFRNVAAYELNVPALLEMFGVPYSGATPACMAWCYDKELVHAVAKAHGVAVPGQVFVRDADPNTSIEFEFPALIKPNTGDGSVGITRGSVVHDATQARACLERLRHDVPGCDALVQEFLSGPECSIGLIGNPLGGFTVLPPLEVDYSGLDADLPQILSYESKTIPTSPYWQQLRYRKAEIDEQRLARIIEVSELLFERLGCRDYGRVDFRTGRDGEIKLLEVNANPAWCWDGKMTIMTGFAGGTESDFFAMVLDAAQKREATSRDERRVVKKLTPQT